MPHGLIGHNQRNASAPPDDRTGLSRAVLSALRRLYKDEKKINLFHSSSKSRLKLILARPTEKSQIEFSAIKKKF